MVPVADLLESPAAIRKTSLMGGSVMAALRTP